MEEESLINGLKVFEEWGLICRPHNVVGRSWGYLAGTDEIRHEELFSRRSAPLMAFARGGWGAARLLEQHHNWEPGWFLGFSDITSLLLARLSKGFYGGIHGPLVTSLANEPSWSKERLKALLFGGPVPELYGEAWVKGKAQGPLVVANLTVSSHLIGSRHMPNLKDAILILEDTDEAPYRIDRMLTHWRLAGLLKDISGLAFGNFNRCTDSIETDKKEYKFELTEILKERCFDLKIPVVGELPIGHCRGNASLPLGKIALLDGDQGKLIVLP